jgi:hypothetical protein
MPSSRLWTPRSALVYAVEIWGDSLAEGDVIHELDVERWAFWSPESAHPAVWRTRWTGGAPEPSPAEVPDDAIPATHRRRMSSLTRLAVQIAIEAAGDCKPDFLIFCSQHGDLTRLREMLNDISSGVELSPTTFSQSVHNASAGLFTIISRSTAPVSALAARHFGGWLKPRDSWSASGGPLPHSTYDEPLPTEHGSAAPCAHLSVRCGLTRVRSTCPRGRRLLPLAPLFLARMLQRRPATPTAGWVWTRRQQPRAAGVTTCSARDP